MTAAPGVQMDEIDLTEVEAAICRLPDVELVRVVPDRSGAPAEIHVVARPGKSPKQIVRDIQSLTTAALGVTIDHRIVSVVQIDREPEPVVEPTTAKANGSGVAPPIQRVRLDSVETEAKGIEAAARVVLYVNGTAVTGVARGSASKAMRPRLVALATLDALREIDDTAHASDVAHAEVVRAGGNDVALVTLAYLAPPTEIIVSGSAVVGAGSWTEAVARAVLDATNRLLTRPSNGVN